MPTGVYPRPALPERFWGRVDKTDECWIWRGATRFGYGIAWVGDGFAQAHRVAYELVVGPIGEGLTLDHLCRNRACVKPAHLEPVALAENIRRALPYRQSALKAACYRGHEMTASNTYIRPDGYRACRACHCIAEAKRRTRAS